MKHIFQARLIYDVANDLSWLLFLQDQQKPQNHPYWSTLWNHHHVHNYAIFQSCPSIHLTCNRARFFLLQHTAKGPPCSRGKICKISYAGENISLLLLHLDLQPNKNSFLVDRFRGLCVWSREYSPSLPLFSLCLCIQFRAQAHRVHPVEKRTCNLSLIQASSIFPFSNSQHKRSACGITTCSLWYTRCVLPKGSPFLGCVWTVGPRNYVAGIHGLRWLMVLCFELLHPVTSPTTGALAKARADVTEKR